MSSGIKKCVYANLVNPLDKRNDMSAGPIFYYSVRHIRLITYRILTPRREWYISEIDMKDV